MRSRDLSMCAAMVARASSGLCALRDSRIVRNPARLLLRSKNIKAADMLKKQFELIVDTLVPCNAGHRKVQWRRQAAALQKSCDCPSAVDQSGT